MYSWSFVCICMVNLLGVLVAFAWWIGWSLVGFTWWRLLIVWFLGGCFVLWQFCEVIFTTHLLESCGFGVFLSRFEWRIHGLTSSMSCEGWWRSPHWGGRQQYYTSTSHQMCSSTTFISTLMEVWEIWLPSTNLQSLQLTTRVSYFTG